MKDNGDLRLRVRLLEHAVRDVDRRLGVVETRLADLLAGESNTQTEPTEERQDGWAENGSWKGSDEEYARGGMFDELRDRYGEGAIVNVRPYGGESGETVRWIVEIDGVDVSDVDVRVREHPEHRDVMLLMLVHGDEEVELDRWHEDARHPHSLKAGAAYSRPASVLRRLGDLR